MRVINTTTSNRADPSSRSGKVGSPIHPVKNEHIGTEPCARCMGSKLSKIILIQLVQNNFSYSFMTQLLNHHSAK